VSTLKEEVKTKKKKAITGEADEVKMLKQEVKDARIAKIIRDEVNDIFLQRSAMKAQMRVDKQPEEPVSEEEKPKQIKKRPEKRFRLPDGRYITV